jgi:hypothetical protein
MESCDKTIFFQFGVFLFIWSRPTKFSEREFALDQTKARVALNNQSEYRTAEISWQSYCWKSRDDKFKAFFPKTSSDFCLEFDVLKKFFI